MTVSSQTPINRSTGNGVTTVFPYGFKIISEADIEVTVDGVVKTLNVDYTVSGVGNEAGGNVTMTAAPAASHPFRLPLDGITNLRASAHEPAAPQASGKSAFKTQR